MTDLYSIYYFIWFHNHGKLNRTSSNKNINSKHLFIQVIQLEPKEADFKKFLDK